MFQQKTHLCVEESGLWLQLSGMPSAYPNGLVGKNALLEVKCPFMQRDSTIEEAVRNGTAEISLPFAKFFSFQSLSSRKHLVRLVC